MNTMSMIVNGKVLQVRLEKVVAESIIFECQPCHHCVEIQQDLYDQRLQQPDICSPFDGGCGQKGTTFKMRVDLTKYPSKHIITLSADHKRYIIWMDETANPPKRGDTIAIEIVDIRAKKGTKGTFYALGTSFWE